MRASLRNLQSRYQPVCSRHIHTQTPLIRSEPLSAALGHPVLLKMDALQPSGSFKLRGIGASVRAARDGGAELVVSSSGGNAGLATAYAARELNIRATVVLPLSTPHSAAERLKAMGADAIFHGAHWNEANAHAEELVAASERRGVRAVLTHPFEGETTWEGHSSLVDEVAEQAVGRVPACLVTVCGGGGLLLGILRGVERQLQRGTWPDRIPIIACETNGADSLARSLEAGELVTLSGISSVAKSLGAVTVSAHAFQAAKIADNAIRSVVCEDADAVNACLRFADDHRVLVEPACGAGLAAVYGRNDALLQCCAEAGSERPVVVEVCGGALVDRASLEAWAREVGVAAATKGED